MADDAPSPEHDALAALRERGADRRDPVRFRLAQGLAQRAAAHAGAARRAIEEKLTALLARFDTGDDAPSRNAVPVKVPVRERGALAALVDHAERQKGAAATAVAASRGAPAHAHAHSGATPLAAHAGAAADAGTVHFFKRTWSRLSADQRLAQSRASLPENAGPLNSQHLVHRSLLLMRELSPDYLERFVGYIDALQWLEQSNEAAAQEAANAGRPAPARRAMAARRG
jgi:hypothetical protein